ncbi:MAG TPA: hypothetical protein VFY14_06660 [Streptomyces sp.]|nr:hypothetical protein [Streptomyces sp.]
MTTPTTTPVPPADAVAKDAHWASTLERLRKRKRPTAVLRICDDHDVKQALGLAQYEERKAQREVEADPGDAGAKKALTAARKAVEKAQQAVDEASIVLRFQALERKALDDLKKEHPPTEEQAEDGYEFNPETLGPELIAASSLDGITPDDARHFLDTWSNAEAADLFNAAWGVQGETRLDLGKG